MECLMRLLNLPFGSSTLEIYTIMILQGKESFSPYARTIYYGLKSVKVEVVKIWNNIPENRSKVENRKVFCRSLKESLLLVYLNI